MRFFSKNSFPGISKYSKPARDKVAGIRSIPLTFTIQSLYETSPFNISYIEPLDWLYTPSPFDKFPWVSRSIARIFFPFIARPAAIFITEVVFATPKQESVEFTGVVDRNQDISKILSIINQTNNIDYKIKKNTITIQ